MATASDAFAASRDQIQSDIQSIDEQLEMLDTKIDALEERLTREFEPDQRFATPAEVKVALQACETRRDCLDKQKLALRNEKAALENQVLEILRSENIRDAQQPATVGMMLPCVTPLHQRKLFASVFCFYSEQFLLVIRRLQYKVRVYLCVLLQVL
jgi:hypothetical protein